ncbi:MAG: hypothetical protein ACE5G3_12270, partial [Gammaproteobacteria bacterium]
MHALIRRAFRFLTYVAAAAVMLLALLVGIARLLLPRVPEYQDDIRTWAVQATGFELRFEHISASWPITGPEIQFLEVTVQSPQDHQPVFTAERLDIGVSLISLLRDRAVVVSRVGVEGTRVEIRRGAGNVFEVQGRQLADYLPARDPQASLRLPELDFELSGIEVAYRDVERSGDVLDFTIRNLDLRLGDSDLSLDGDVTLSSRFGERAAVSIDVPLGVLESVLADGDADEEPNAEEWSAYVTGEALDFAHIVGYALDMATPLANMRGDIVVWAGFTGTGPTGVTAELDFTDVELHRSPDLVDRYEEISGRIEWERDADGWLLAGSGLNLRREGRFSPRSDFSLRLRGAADEKTRQWQGSAAFLRLQDWFPILRAIVTEDVRDQMLPSDVSGDIRDLALGLRSTPGGDTEFDLNLRFDDLGIAGLPGGRTLTGMTGAVVADQDGGRLELDSDKVVGSM